MSAAPWARRPGSSAGRLPRGREFRTAGAAPSGAGPSAETVEGPQPEAGAYTAFVEDPDGHLVELIEPLEE